MHPADVQSRKQSRQGLYASAGRCMQLQGRTQTNPKAGETPTLKLVVCSDLPNTYSSRRSPEKTLRLLFFFFHLEHRHTLNTNKGLKRG